MWSPWLLADNYLFTGFYCLPSNPPHSHLYENKNIVKTKIKDFYAKNKATVGDPSKLVENFLSTIPLSKKKLSTKEKINGRLCK